MSSRNRSKGSAIAGALILQGCAHSTLLAPPENHLQVSRQVALTAPVPQQNIEQLRRNQYLIIDLRTAAEQGQRHQQQEYQNHNIAYQHLPVHGAEVTREHINRLAEYLSNHQDNPVIIQCASGNRAALLWASYRIVQGDAASAAEAAVAPLASKAAIVDAIRQFAAKQASAAQ